MRFKLDENLPAEVASDVAEAGHEAETVVQEGIAGMADGHLLEAARHEDRVLMTLDKGIANIHRYPPAGFAGVVLFRPDSMGRGGYCASSGTILAKCSNWNSRAAWWW